MFGILSEMFFDDKVSINLSSRPGSSTIAIQRQRLQADRRKGTQAMIRDDSYHP